MYTNEISDHYLLRIPPMATGIGRKLRTGYLNGICRADAIHSTECNDPVHRKAAIVCPVTFGASLPAGPFHWPTDRLSQQVARAA
jgi:hypothetical protein